MNKAQVIRNLKQIYIKILDKLKGVNQGTAPYEAYELGMKLEIVYALVKYVSSLSEKQVITMSKEDIINLYDQVKELASKIRQNSDNPIKTFVSSSIDKFVK